VRVVDAGAQRHVVEVQPGEIARVGLVLEAEVDVVGAEIDGGFQGRGSSCGTYETNAR